MVALRKAIVQADGQFVDEIQGQLNSLKNMSSTVYNMHKANYDKIIPIKDEIAADYKFAKLCALADSDYIRYALEVATKKDRIELTDRNFEQFLDMPHLELLIGKPSNLLKGMINKIFTLKNKDDELVNTISGNLVIFDPFTPDYR